MSAGLAACAGSGSGSAHYSASVTTPELVYIEPEVQVIVDYHEPVFYTDNYYWRYESGVWYRSDNHVRGWVRFEAIPPRLRRIEQPTRYVRWRGEASGGVNTGGPVVRDHRDQQWQPQPQPTYPAQPQPQPTYPAQPQPTVQPTRPHPVHPVHPGQGHGVQPQPQPQPVHVHPVRDPKADRKDLKEDQKAERKELHQDQKAERKDLKEDQKDIRKDVQAAPKEVRKDVQADQKGDRKELEQKQKEERKEQKQEQKEERKDQKKGR